MGEVTRIVVRSGILPESTLAQLRQWGAIIDVSPDPDASVERMPKAIQQAVEEEDFIRVRETDLEILKHYLKSQETGTLTLVSGDWQEVIEVYFGRTPRGEIIIPWDDDTLEDTMLNGETYFQDSTKVKLSFVAMRELYYGERKAFMVLETVEVP